MSSIEAEVKKFARAIAVANGHPDPAAWAEDVANAYGDNAEGVATGQVPFAAPVETTEKNDPLEITLQQETPAV